MLTWDPEFSQKPEKDVVTGVSYGLMANPGPTWEPGPRALDSAGPLGALPGAKATPRL